MEEYMEIVYIIPTTEAKLFNTLLLGITNYNYKYKLSNSLTPKPAVLQGDMLSCQKQCTVNTSCP